MFGIGTQPLRDDYINDAYQKEQRYALTFDSQGMITDAATRYGLGLIVVRRGTQSASNVFTIDIVSYERALPLWRGSFAVSSL